jgi:hypothetical protein
VSPPFWFGLGGGARGALAVVEPSLLSSLSGPLMEGTCCFSGVEVSDGTYDGAY